jgi:HEAT repeat protein
MNSLRVIRHAVVGVVLVGTTLLTLGCAATSPADPQLRDRATLCLHRGMRFPGNAAVRAEAMEAAGEVLGVQAAQVIREGLRDEHPGVRFAACMALGATSDRASADAVRPLVNDPDMNVRVGAYYALERMGDFGYRQTWADVMRKDKDSAVRRNAVMAMGLLGNAKALPLLKRVAADDSDDGVRLQAVEAMAILGDADAEARFIRDAFGGMGYRQPFALLVLGRAKGPEVIGILSSRLAHAPYLEARLAAARGLAMHGGHDGYDLARASLSWNSPKQDLPDDPEENQIMRVRTMAAMALGEMHDRRALGSLSACMESADDPRIQLATARAILNILNNSQPSAPAPTSAPAAPAGRP